MPLVFIVIAVLLALGFGLAVSVGKVASATPPVPPAKPKRPSTKPIQDHCKLHPEYFAGCGDCESAKVFADTVAEFQNNKGEK